MQIVILAGGLGTRLKEDTKTIPKPMMSINNIPFLQIQLQSFSKYNFKKILLCTGYLSHVIEKYFSDGKKFDLEITYSKEEKPLGTGGALLNAIHLLDDEFLVVNGDTFLDFDYSKLIQFARSKNSDCTIVSYCPSDGELDAKNNLLIQNSKLIQYSKQSTSKSMNCIDAGMYYFKKSTLTNISHKIAFSLEGDVFPQLASDNKIDTYIQKTKFFDIGTPERIKIFLNYLKRNNHNFS